MVEEPHRCTFSSHPRQPETLFARFSREEPSSARRSACRRNYGTSLVAPPTPVASGGSGRGSRLRAT